MMDVTDDVYEDESASHTFMQHASLECLDVTTPPTLGSDWRSFWIRVRVRVKVQLRLR